MLTCLLYTPGLDSRLAAWVLRKKKIPFVRCYVDINSRYSRIEMDLLKRWNCRDLIVLKGPNLGSVEDDRTAFIPNRNAIIATVAQTFLNCDVLLFSSVKDDRVLDSSKEFRSSLSKTLSISAGRKIVVDSVLHDREKAEWVRLFAERNPKKKLTLLTKTYSCYSSFLTCNYMHYYYKRGKYLLKSRSRYPILGCLDCKACFRRLCALTAANIYVPMKENSEVLMDYVNEVFGDEHKHEQFRNKYRSRYNSIMDYLFCVLTPQKFRDRPHCSVSELDGVLRF